MTRAEILAKYAQKPTRAQILEKYAASGPQEVNTEGKADRSDYQAPTMLGSAIAGLGDAATFGFGDEIYGGLNYLAKGGKEGSYAEGRDAVRKGMREAQEVNPGSFLTGQVAGGVGTALIPGGAAIKGAGLLTKMARAGLVGAVEGGAYGAGSADGDLQDRALGAAKGAGVGGLLGAAGPAIGAGIGRFTGKLPNVRTSEEWQGVKNQLYKTVEDAGVTVKPEAVDMLIERIGNRAVNNNINPARHPGSASILKELQDQPQAALSLSRIDAVRSELGRVAAADPKGPDGFMARQLRKEIDHFTTHDNLPRMVDVPQGVNPRQVVQTLQYAREANKRYRNVERIERAFYLAENSNLARSGNMDDAIRNQFKKIADSESQMARFTPEQQSDILKITRQGGAKNRRVFTRAIARLAPTSGVMNAMAGPSLGGTLGATVGGMVGGPVGATIGGAVGGVAVPAVGEAVKRRIGSATTRAARDVEAHVSAGTRVKRNVAPAQKKATRALIGASPVVQGMIPPLELTMGQPRNARVITHPDGTQEVVGY